MAINVENVLPPWAVDADSEQAPTYTGSDVTRLFSGLFAGRTGVDAEPGILKGLDIQISGATVQIYAGTCLVATGMGPVLTGVRTAVSFPIPAKHATYTRKDAVYLIVETQAASGRGARLEYVEGTPAPSPTLPVDPANSLRLGEITVPATGAPSITRTTPSARLNTTDAVAKPKTVQVKGTGFTGKITGIISDLGGLLKFENVTPTALSQGQFVLPLNGNNSDLNVSGLAVGLLHGYTASNGSKTHLYPARIGSDRLQIFGLTADTRLNGVINYNLNK